MDTGSCGTHSESLDENTLRQARCYRDRKDTLYEKRNCHCLFIIIPVTEDFFKDGCKISNDMIHHNQITTLSKNQGGNWNSLSCKPQTFYCI